MILKKNMKHCRFCNKYLDGKALVCIECRNSQTLWHKLIVQYAFIWDLVKLAVIPTVLWFAASAYTSHQQEIEAVNKTYSEFTGIFSAVEADNKLMYDTCYVTNESAECRKQVNRIHEKGIADFALLRNSVLKYYPDLFASFELIRYENFAVETEFRNMWTSFFKCLDDGVDQSECTLRRKRVPNLTYSAVDYIAGYAQCRIEETYRLSTKKAVSLQCQDILLKRVDLAVNKPTKAVASFTRADLGYQFNIIIAQIINEEIFPGSGLPGAPSSKK
jgi:hypothetical protein